MEEITVIDELLNSKLSEMSSIIEEATRFFSDNTNYAALAITSKRKKGTVKRFEGILIDKNNILIVMITSTNLTKTRQIKTQVEIDTATLALIVRVLNESLANVKLEDINVALIINIENQLGAYRDIFSPIVRTVYEVISEIDRFDVRLDGVSNLLRYPEFADVIKARSILSALEERGQLISMLSQAKDGINVYIGDDSLPGSMNDTSIIFHTFDIDGSVVGAVGLIGPRRMDYSKVISKLEYFTRNLIATDNNMKTDRKGNNDDGR